LVTDEKLRDTLRCWIEHEKIPSPHLTQTPENQPSKIFPDVGTE